MDRRRDRRSRRSSSSACRQAPESKAPSEPKAQQARPRRRLQRQLDGAPPPLAALHAQANELLPGARKAPAGARARAARAPGRGQHLGVVVRPVPRRDAGHPARVAGLRHARRVPRRRPAATTAAPRRSFLRDIPLTYPSYEDPDGKIANALPRSRARRPRSSTTPRASRPTSTRASTVDAPQLDDDIERYALGVVDRRRPRRRADRGRGRRGARAAHDGVRRRAGRDASRRSSTAATTRRCTSSPSTTARSSAPAGCWPTAPTLKLGRMAVARSAARRRASGCALLDARRRARPRALGARADRARRPAQRACRSTSRPATPRAATSSSTPGIEHVRMEKQPCLRSRVDPLTGLRRRSSPPSAPVAPGRRLQSRRRRPTRSTPRRDPFLEGHEDRTPPELYALRAERRGARHARAGGARRAEPLPGARRRTRRAADRDARSTCSPSTPARGRARGDRQRAAPRHLAGRPRGRRRSRDAIDVWRERIAHHAENGAAYVHLIVNERREAGASLPHTHAQLYALDFVPAVVARERERFGAYAPRTMGGNLLADLVQEEVRLRERIVAIDDEAVAAWRRTARGSPYQLHARAARAARRASRTTARSAPRCCTTACAASRGARHVPPLNLWVRTAPRGAEHFCWRIDIVPRLTHMAGLELGTGVHLNIVAPEQAAAELREVVRMRRSSSASSPRGRARRRRDRSRADRRPGCSCCSASPTTTTRRSATGWPTRSRALRIFADAEGRMNEALGDARGARRQPVHALRRHAQGQPAALRRRGAGPSMAEPLYERFCDRLGAAARRVRRAHGGRAGQRRAGDAAARACP